MSPALSPPNSQMANLIAQLVRADKLKLLFHQSYLAAFVAFAVCVLLSWLVWNEAAHSLLLGWMAAMALATVVRLALFVAYVRMKPDGADLLRWERPYVFTLALTSLTWGLGAAAVMASVPLLGQVISIFVMVGMAGGAVSTYSPFRAMAVMAMLAVLLPGTLWLLLQGDRMHVGLALGALIFMVVSLRATRVQALALHRSFQASREMEHAHEIAELLARTDALTGINNRRAFFERGQQIIHYCERNGRPLCILLMDVDHFKNINDEFGHAVGDAALQYVGDTLRRLFRKADVCGRIGGEEFAILLPETPLRDAEVMAESLRMTIAEMPIPTPRQTLAITVSIGVANDGYDLDTLLSRADAAMYRAKAEGRNRVIASAPVE